MLYSLVPGWHIATHRQARVGGRPSAGGDQIVAGVASPSGAEGGGEAGKTAAHVRRHRVRVHARGRQLAGVVPAGLRLGGGVGGGGK